MTVSSDFTSNHNLVKVYDLFDADKKAFISVNRFDSEVDLKVYYAFKTR